MLPLEYRGFLVCPPSKSASTFASLGQWTLCTSADNRSCTEMPYVWRTSAVCARRFAVRPTTNTECMAPDGRADKRCTPRKGVGLFCWYLRSICQSCPSRSDRRRFLQSQLFCHRSPPADMAAYHLASDTDCRLCLSGQAPDTVLYTPKNVGLEFGL